MKSISPFILLILLCFSTPFFAQKTTTNFYIDPVKGNDTATGLAKSQAFRTIKQAQKAVQNAIPDMKSDIYIWLCGGNYQLTEPIVFGNKDGGKNGFNVIYKACKNEPVNIHGGIQVTGWKLFDKNKNIWCATIPAGADSRQLFVNNVRAQRARSIGNEKRWIVSDSIGHLTSDLSFLKWKNPSNIECVYREIWTAPRCGVQQFKQLNDTTLRIEMKQPGWRYCRNKGITSARTPWYFENAYELLDEAGEWYLDKSGAISGKANTIFYKPEDNQDVAKLNFVLPLAEKLFVVKGESAEKPVQNLIFDGLNLSYTTWLRPNSNNGNSDAQNNVLRESKTAHGEMMADGAALSLHFAHNIKVENCSFTKLGCAGINMFAGCKNNVVNQSYFYDIAATGIQMGDYKRWKEFDSDDSHFPANNAVVLSGNKITNNHIENCGVEYRSSTGIAAAFPVDLLIQGNTVMNMPYSGMHIGWGWTTFPQTVMKNNRISHNFVQNVMLELADGGSIYTLGGNEKEQWSFIHDNYMYRVMWGQCVYMDNGSSFYKIDNNVYKDGDDYNVKINSGSHDIHVTGVYSNKKQDLVGKTGCYNYSIDSTQLFNNENKTIVEKIRNNAGAFGHFKQAWSVYPDLLTYEAEHAEVEGKVYATAGIGTKVFGYSGMGFLAGFDRNALGGVVFNINVSKAGKYKLNLKYAAGKGWGDKIELAVNKGKSCKLILKPTSSKNDWATNSTAVKLKKGVNTVRIFSTELNSSFLYIDKLSLEN